MKLELSCLVVSSLSALSISQSISAVHYGRLSCGAGENERCKPLLIIAEGPTGSGKTSQELELQRIFNIKSDNLVAKPPKVLLVDDLVEKDAGYRQNILAFLRQQLGPNPTFAEVDTWTGEADATVYDFFAKEYFGCRKDWGCNAAGQGGCERVFNDNMNRSVQADDNMIWETTGNKYPTKKFNDKGLPIDDYEVVVGINVVDFCDLQKRNSGRATRAIMNFMNDPENLEVPAPRLPDLTKLGDATQKIVDANLDTIDCVGEPVSAKCPGKIDDLFVFDNEHWGFLPSIKLSPLDKSTPEAQRAFSELKTEAKNMLMFMKPKSCSPTIVV